MFLMVCCALCSVFLFYFGLDNKVNQLILTPCVTCSGDHGQPGPPGFRGSAGPNGTSDRPGHIGDAGFIGPKGYRGEKINFDQKNKLIKESIPCFSPPSSHWYTLYNVALL